MTTPRTTDDLAAQHAIRALLERYAHCADRRLPEQQADLYVEGGRTLIYRSDPADSEPARVLATRAEHLEAFRAISRYAKTTHLIGQSTVLVDGDGATGETYCLAHHVLEADGQSSLIVIAVRYEDTFARVNGQWRFRERRLITDWTQTRPLSS